MKHIIILLLCSIFPFFVFAQNLFPVQSVHGSTKEVVDIQVTDMDGTVTALSDFLQDDKNYVISIMASWCGPCRIELDVFNMVVDKWREEYDTEIIALSVDKPNDAQKLAALVKKQGWNMNVLHDKMGYSARELEVFSIPQTFLVNKKREITYETKGYKSNLVSKYEKRLRKLQY